MSEAAKTVPGALLEWAAPRLPAGWYRGDLRADTVAGDASQRRYFRLFGERSSCIAVVAPPDTQNNADFIAVRDCLDAGGVRVPALLATDIDRGYLLLEDFGDCLLLDELNAASVDDRYREALALLTGIAAARPPAGCPRYDTDTLAEELGRFAAWFVEPLLGYSPPESEVRLLDTFSERLIATALEQPRVFTHRDFHSRNLMCLSGGKLGVIDFQDAVLGPLTYDPVSLLRDCYVRWPATRVERWALAYREQRLAAGLPAGASDAQFLCWFDWMGLHRHLKVLGTFARLHLRDGKSAYLDDLPLVLAYVREITARYAGSEPLFAEFQAWFQRRLDPLIQRQPWNRAV